MHYNHIILDHDSVTWREKVHTEYRTRTKCGTNPVRSVFFESLYTHHITQHQTHNNNDDLMHDYKTFNSKRVLF